EARLRLDRPLPEGTLLQAQYQGCADAGLCYPPQSTEVVLAAGSAPAQPLPTAPAPAAGGGLQGLPAGPQPLLTLGGFCGAGLLLAFTACLYPMIPILSGLIAGDRHRGGMRAFLLSLVYVEATAVTYALAGIAAGLSGVAIQADLQSPWILGAFAGLFVVLALAMFGVFTLQLPAGLQTRLTELARTNVV